MIWKSDTKHRGFVVDMGPNSPFATDDIIDGSDKSVSVMSKTRAVTSIPLEPAFLEQFTGCAGTAEHSSSWSSRGLLLFYDRTLTMSLGNSFDPRPPERYNSVDLLSKLH